ncbi:MAG: NusG domain II-containing protein [Lachnospiraceae bacterium]|nr:NusG domain II-containing protein [Lachnospiraceae bacterium]
MAKVKEEGKLKKKQYLLTLYVFLGICLISLLLLLALGQRNTGRKVQISQIKGSGKVVIKEIYIDHARDQEFVIECEEGYNIIKIKDHQLYVKEADCPGQDCVEMGTLKEGLLPIICIPHYLVIEFVEEE